MAFYHRWRHEAQKRKCQLHKFNSNNSSSSHDAFAKKGPYHWRFVACNLLTASLFAGLTAESYARNWWWPTTRSQLTVGEASSPFSIARREGLLMLLVLGWQSILEYWWHRLMHVPWCYRRMHKFHHYYKVCVGMEQVGGRSNDDSRSSPHTNTETPTHRRPSRSTT